IDQKGTEDAGKQGHQIKGAAGNVGANTLREIASDIETAGKAGELDRLIFLVPRLEEAFDQLKKVMEEMIR
ncbi:MAG: Hpt domain-containing protein, partial [Deltaproteobacteria bacterium]|nr:Hpt domain-containing protein [Deltaproteobacteria bacterium]